MWLILAGPALLGLLILVIELAHIWLARVELENALGSAALAAVKEWGDAGGGSTECPRHVGVTYAAGNNISGVPLSLTTNFDSNQPNGNDSCTGDLIFGAIIDQSPPFRFDAGETPGCGAALAALDITGQSSLGSSNNSFGISFQPTIVPSTSTLRITRVIYILPEKCMIGNATVEPRFDFRALNQLPEVSSVVEDCDSNAFLQDNCPSGGPNNPGPSAQADVFGIVGSSVNFYIDILTGPMDDPCDSSNGTLVNNLNIPTTVSRTLALEFSDFDLEDRIRFGANVIDNMGGQIGADELGACGTTVIICFDDNTSVMGTFEDNDEKRNACLQCVDVAAWGSNTLLDDLDCQMPPTTAGNHGLVIHPRGIADIPCPAGSGNNNNGQAIATLSNSGTGAFPFAVRAQKTIEVNSLFCELAGISLGPFFITAKETAFYDCAIRCPRLIRIEPGNFICP